MKNLLAQFWDDLGPGLITGASDDDPSGIATYSQAGAKFGLLTLWTALVTYPLMFGIQEMCARIGIVTKSGLGRIFKNYYPKFTLWILIGSIFPAITFNIAADLAGMGAVAHLLFPLIPKWIYALLFTSLLMIGLIFCSYQKMAFVLKWLCLSLLVYIFVPFFVKQNWPAIGHAVLIPRVEWSKDFWMILVAILGTTISPYLFFWQNSMSLEESNHNHSLASNKKEIQKMQFDVNVGMFFSNFVMFFIILTTASVLFPNGITHIETVEDAAKALEPLVGHYAYLLFSLGVIGTGLLAIPILAGCLGYLFADIFDWSAGMDKTYQEAKNFYRIILSSIIIGFMVNLLGIDPIQSLIYTAIIYGLLAPFLIVCLLHICNSPSIMNENTNPWWSNLLGCLAFLIMGGSAIFMIYFL